MLIVQVLGEPFRPEQNWPGVCRRCQAPSGRWIVALELAPVRPVVLLHSTQQVNLPANERLPRLRRPRRAYAIGRTTSA